MFKKIIQILFIGLLFFETAHSQTTITTNHSNNNGNASITFNVHNSNSYDIVVTDLQCMLGTTVNNYCQLLVNTTPVNDNAPPWDGGTIGNGLNGWVLKGSATIPSNTGNGIVPAISGLEILIPAGATYGFGFSATTLQYQSLAMGTNIFTEQGVSIITGDGVSWGGIAYPATPANYPRGFIGGITFVPAISCVSPPIAGTVSSNRGCTADPIRFWVPYSGTNATYQWQSSSTGTNFTSIPNATSRAYNTSVTSETYFRCYVTCGGVTDTSVYFNAGFPKTGHITPTICYGTTFELNGTIYGSTGTYTQVLTAENGCDSTLTIDLTISDQITGTLDTAICAGTTLTIGGSSYTTAGTFTKVLTAANGCDSTLTLSVTLRQPTNYTFTQTACSSYNLNGTTYTSSGVYTQTLLNVAGCDSTITLNLDIESADASVTQNGHILTANNNSAGVTYQWIDCATGNIINGATAQTYLATSNGSYKVVVSKESCPFSSLCYTVDNIKGDVSVYPNPSNGAFTIRLGKTYPKIQVELLDINGKLVMHRQEVNKDVIVINETLVAGVYKVRINAGGVVQTKTLVIGK